MYKMNSQRITTSINYEEHRLCKENNWKWNELIRLGIAAKVKPDVIHEKVIIMQEEINALRRKLQAKELQQKIPHEPIDRQSALSKMMGWKP